MKDYTRNKLRRCNLAWPDGRAEAQIVQLCAGHGRLGHAPPATPDKARIVY
jgi:hypothetical protein